MNLKSVKIGNAVTSIGFSSFIGCEKLEYIVFPSTLNFVDTNPRANGIANDNVYDPFGGCPSNFKMFFEGSTIPEGNHPDSGAWVYGHATYISGQWYYDTNGIPRAN